MLRYKFLFIRNIAARSPRVGFSIVGAVVVAVLIGGLGFYLDGENAEANRKALNEQIDRDARLVQSAISRQINADLTAAEHLGDVVAADPDIQTEMFDKLADDLLRRNRHFLGIALAPDFIVSSTRPGHAFLQWSGSDAAPGSLFRVPRTQTTLFTRNGRETITLTLPIKVAAPGDADRPWGAVAVQINERRFFQRVGLEREDGEISASALGLDYLDIAIRDLARKNEPNSPFFFGPADFGGRETVTKMVGYPGGAWEVVVAPKVGWRPPADTRFPFRLVAVIAGISMIIPIFVASMLIAERNRNIAELKKREEKLVELSKRFNLAMETSNIGIWEFNESNHSLHWDLRASELHGQREPKEDFVDRLADWLAVVHPDDREMAEAHFFRGACHDASGPFEMIYRVIGPEGMVRHLRSVGAYSSGSGGQGRFIGIVWDITADRLFTQTLRDAKETSDIKNAELELALDELSSREQELEELSHKFDLALASYHCGIWEADPVTHASFWDERMHQLIGIPFKPVMRPLAEFLSHIHPEDRDKLKAAIEQTTSVRTAIWTVRVMLPGGELRYVRSVGQLHNGRDGIQKIIGIAFDVTADMLMTEQLKAAKEEADARNLELEMAKNRIEYNALHDPLTGLANRRKFDMELEELSRRGQTSRIKFTILHLDLDRFKEINDTLGHAAGDAMLVNAAKILARNVRDGDLVARIGGDEFVILAKDTTDRDMLARLSERIIDEMGQPIDFEGFSCRCGVSIGIASPQGAQADARKVLINADLALYEAKARGRNCYEFFSQDLQSNIVNSKRMADEILSGLERDQFTVWYQPQFSANSMTLSGVEALVRWNHPDRGVMASGTFIKIAEELNVMARIDQLVLEKTLRDRMLWTARGLKIPKVSVNVSSRRLHDRTLIDQLASLTIEPGTLAFELVESIFLDESDEISTGNIDRIKAMGIDIEIDDFGTGHTSIVSLLKLKPKRLKIDRQLVMPIMNAPQERTLVRSIIDIARSLGVETVAEGVETAGHARLLQELGCDYLQGYAFARPLPSEDFYRFVLNEEWRQAS